MLGFSVCGEVKLTETLVSQNSNRSLSLSFEAICYALTARTLHYARVPYRFSGNMTSMAGQIHRFHNRFSINCRNISKTFADLADWVKRLFLSIYLLLLTRYVITNKCVKIITNHGVYLNLRLNY